MPARLVHRHAGWIAPAALLLMAGSAAAQSAPVVVSSAPDAVSVTVYRDPADGDFSRTQPRGFAVISERRRVRLPAGPADLRFEGVANGMVAVSAVIEGLPGAVVEKNLDARLLTPLSLVRAAVGGEAVLERTDPATGRRRTIPVRILSGHDGVLLQSAEGVEALRCSALPERLVLPHAPDGLSDKPTLSVRTESTAAGEAEVTLSYLAQGFDWAASYVAMLDPAREQLTLTAWITFANANSVSFTDAPTQIIAGKVRRASSPPLAARRLPPLNPAECWPWDTTATAAVLQAYAEAKFFALPPPPAPMAMAMARADSIMVTGARVQREEFGDLQLYRTPEPTSILANAQKQVLLLSEPDVPFSKRFEMRLEEADGEPRAAQIVLEVENKRDGPLAQPLPKGRIVVFEPTAHGSVLLGETGVTDLAIGERLKLRLGGSRTVSVEHSATGPGRFVVVARNRGGQAAVVEVRRPLARVKRSSAAHRREGEDVIWRLSIPAGSERRFHYEAK